MQYFDLHADTLYRIYTENIAYDSDLLAVNFRKAHTFQKYAQMLAIWIPDEIRGTDAYDFFRRCADLYINKFHLHNDKNTKFYLSVENGSVIGGDIERIKNLNEYGVRAVTLVYNEDNELGSGCMSDSNFGLTCVGKLAVKEFERNNITIDLSHSSERTFYDVADISVRPIIATHSNSYTLCRHKRNLTDQQFKVIRDSKGLVGVNFYPIFLRDDYENAALTDVIEHIEYFLSLGGEDVVCLGSDFDGCKTIDELSDISKVPILYESLLKLNYNEQLVQKIFFCNAQNFFT